MFRFFAAVLLVGVFLVTASTASAQAALLNGFGGPAGFGVDELPPDDDNSSTAISLAVSFPGGMRFFGTTYTDLFVNTNGNVSFAMPLAAFTPMAFPIASQPIIAPWWADVDTRGAAPATENRVYWHSEVGRFIATWFRVGYFDSHVDLTNGFQLVLTDRSAIGSPGDFDVEFRYNQLEWTTGDASGGTTGLGGTPAQAGFDAGNTVDFLTLPGSRMMTVLDLETTTNVGVTGVWRFQVRGGGVTTCGNGTMETGEACDDGNTVAGDGCSARCDIELAVGEVCVDPLECISGFCSGGFCCVTDCTGACEQCATGTCAPTAAGTLCRPAVDTCDAEELCDGAASACPLDVPVPDGVMCADATFCDGEETCVAGMCTAGMPPCDDLDMCTADSCAEASGCANDEISGCRPDGGGEDAGVEGRDAGPADAGLLDGGTMDGGVDPGTPAGSGLSCDVHPRAGSWPAGSWLLLALVFCRRRREGGP